MFEALGDKFGDVFQRLRGEAHLTEDNIKDAMRDVRMALLEADVNFKVVKDFTSAVREKALGQEVTRSVRAGQMFVKIVHDELVVMMGGTVDPGQTELSELGLPSQGAKLDLQKGKFQTVLLLGLQGSGKTTFSGKLALRLKKEGFNPLLVACDLVRPAAVEQLKVVGRNVGVPVFEMGTSHPAPDVARAGIEQGRAGGHDIVIVDTAGRLHIDEVKMTELESVKAVVQPRYSFFVADAMTGQDAVNSATHFNDGIGIDGVVLTKLDGDARGGAALSIRAVTGKPIYFVGVGEKPEDLELFHPDRMASRILGMGDVVSLVEKVQEVADEKEALEMQKKLKREQFDLADFLEQMRKIKKLGPLTGLMKMIPGMGDLLKQTGPINDDAMKPFETMIQSMTPWERSNPDAITGSRIKRIAKGSGHEEAAVKAMLTEFRNMRKMMSQMMNMSGMMKSMMGSMKGKFDPNGPPPTAEQQQAMARQFAQKAGRSGAGPGGEPSKTKPKHRRKKKKR
jgi:signal recognition particle subunit SRP54